jgi:hypothetical protein
VLTPVTWQNLLHERMMETLKTLLPATVSMETYGGFGEPCMRYLNHLSEAAASRTVSVSSGPFWPVRFVN